MGTEERISSGAHDAPKKLTAHLFLMINAFETGGGERQFVTLVDELRGSAFQLSLGCISRKGPLASEPPPLGLLMAGESAAAVDFIGAHLLGYEPDRVPIVREAFGDFVWPLVHFCSDEVRLCGDFGQGRPEQMLIDVINQFSVKHPVGWRAAARAGVPNCDFLCKETAEV